MRSYLKNGLIVIGFSVVAFFAGVKLANESAVSLTVKEITQFSSITSKSVAEAISKELKQMIAPWGVASMNERILLEWEFEKFLMGNENIYGVRNITSEKNGEQESENGTGFIIDSGILATANHLLQPPYTIEIFRNNSWKKVNVMGQVHTKDFSFIRLYPSYFSDIMRLKSAREVFKSFPTDRKEVPLKNVLVGMKCMAFGEPRVVMGELRTLNVESGEISFVVHVDTGGCSGTAVYMMDGYIIGLFQTRYGLVAGALDIDEVAKALKTFKAHEGNNKIALTKSR
jgi:hypothetical protein